MIPYHRKVIVDRKDKLESALYFLSLVVIAMGIILRLIAFLYNRSLFLDEAFLASSVVQRGFTGLFQPLDYDQGAPVGYLFLVKIILYLFGSSEYSLRLLPLLTGIGSIFIFYIILKNVFNDQRPWIGTAFFATIPFLIYYSIEFKPYMFDGFLTLVSIYLFSLAIKQKFKPWVIYLYCATVLWFSFPAIFTIAAFCIVWLIYSIIEKQKTAIKISLITGIVTFISFGLFFVTIYKNLHENQESPYWDLIKFPLVPHGIKDIKLIILMCAQYVGAYGTGKYLLILMSLAAVTFFWTKKRALFGIFLAVEIALILVASWLGRYGILSRLLLFVIPLHVFLVALFVSDLWLKRRITAIVLSFAFILINLGSLKFAFPQKVFRQKYEINPILKKLEPNNNSIPLYLYAYTIPQYEFKTGYQMKHILPPDIPTENKNVIYGSDFLNFKFQKPYSWEFEIDSLKLAQNIQSIISHDQVYILLALYNDILKDTFVNNLKKTGNVVEVMNEYNTLLYLYKKHYE